MDASYAVAYCDISRQYYRLTLSQGGKIATDFTLCEAAPALKPGKRRKIVTDAKLLPCPVCGRRDVASCGCARRFMPCEPQVGFRFSCIYCNNLRLLRICNAK